MLKKLYTLKQSSTNQPFFYFKYPILKNEANVEEC